MLLKIKLDFLILSVFFFITVFFVNFIDFNNIINNIYTLQGYYQSSLFFNLSLLLNIPNLSYLFIFYFILISSLFLKKKSNLYIYIYIIYYLYYNTESIFYIFNTTDFVYNQLLENNLNKIHPPLLYICFFFLLISIKLFLGYNFYNKLFLASLYYFNLNIIILNIFGILFLGSWWAFQIGTWGGWWVWDPSELLLLNIFIFFLSTLHIKICKKLVNNIIIYFLFFLLVYYIYWIFYLEFNSSSLHTFFSNTLFTLDLSEFILFSYLFYIIYHIIVIFQNPSFFNKLNNFNFFYSSLFIYKFIIIFSFFKVASMIYIYNLTVFIALFFFTLMLLFFNFRSYFLIFVHLIFLVAFLKIFISSTFFFNTISYFNNIHFTNNFSFSFSYFSLISGKSEKNQLLELIYFNEYFINSSLVNLFINIKTESTSIITSKNILLNYYNFIYNFVIEDLLNFFY